MKEALKALDRLCNMASGQAGQDFSCAKVDYWTVKDAINNKWQPIETAPRDGTEIIVINDSKGGYCTEPYQIGVATWGQSLSKVRWTSTVCCDGVSYFQPTHWMPLPAPPGEDE